MVVGIHATLAETGEHDFVLRTLNEDGQSIIPDVTGQFRVPEGGGGAVIVADLVFQLPSYGRYTFRLIVDRQELAHAELHAIPVETKTQSGGGIS